MSERSGKIWWGKIRMMEKRKEGGKKVSTQI